MDNNKDRRTNANHNDENVADAIMIHEMNRRIQRSQAHGNKEYIGSEGCQGPQGKDNIEKYMEGKNEGDTGMYILIRPLQPLKILVDMWKKL